MANMSGTKMLLVMCVLSVMSMAVKSAPALSLREEELLLNLLLRNQLEMKERSDKRVCGTVKWFFETKGFGFITPDSEGPEVFAHFEDITGDGFRTLVEGQKVSYEVIQSQKGPQAKKISIGC